MFSANKLTFDLQKKPYEFLQLEWLQLWKDYVMASFLVSTQSSACKKL